MTRSGFLEDYERLQPAPEYQTRWIPDEILLDLRPTEAGPFSTVVIEPVRFVIADEDHAPSGKTREYLAEEFGVRLRTALSKDFRVVAAGEEADLRVRAAVTAADRSSILINIIGIILLVPVDMGGVSVELEVLEVRTGKRVVAFSAHRDGTPLIFFECFFTWGQARHGMKKLSTVLRRLLRAAGATPLAVDTASP